MTSPEIEWQAVLNASRQCPASRKLNGSNCVRNCYYCWLEVLTEDRGKEQTNA
jgi:DNA repair photolyase